MHGYFPQVQGRKVGCCWVLGKDGSEERGVVLGPLCWSWSCSCWCFGSALICAFFLQTQRVELLSQMWKIVKKWYHEGQGEGKAFLPRSQRLHLLLLKLSLTLNCPYGTLALKFPAESTVQITLFNQTFDLLKYTL